MRFSRNTKLITVSSLAIFCVIYVLVFGQGLFNATYYYYTSSYFFNFLPPLLTETRNICELPKLDPWDPTIANFVKPRSLYKVDPDFKVLTKLENGILLKNFNDTTRDCAFRCMFPVNDKHLRYGDWNDIGNGTTPKCDNIETKCFHGDSEKPDYEYMHSQIYRKDTKLEWANPKNPNVHIFIIDSMSHSSLLRTMPKTIETLKSEYGAILFPHLNKLGLNSRPNAYALLLGKQVGNISKSPFSAGYQSDYKNHEESCFKSLDDDQNVFSLFKSAEYTTAHMDDWAAQLLTPTNVSD